MKSILTGLRRVFHVITHPPRFVWRRFRALGRRSQWAVGVLLAVLILGFSIFGSDSTVEQMSSYERTVTLSSVGSLSGAGISGNVIGTVRSITEAKILSQTGGTVRRVNAQIGSSVGGGSVIAELENASERAAVLQAEGSYDAAVAANEVTVIDVTTDIRSAYQSNFNDLDTALEVQVDSLFGDSTATTPGLTAIVGWEKAQELTDLRREISYRMNTWRRNLPTAQTASPETLLTEMEVTLEMSSTLVVTLAESANQRSSGATATQLSNLATARTTIGGLTSEVASLRNAYEAQKLGAGTGASSASEANVKQALGSLRLAQAALEKTVVRAPIAGTVNFLPIRVGDYVTSFTHVATVAQNGALEIVAYVSEEQRAALVVGERVTIEDTRVGIITAIAPALDPITKQIELRVAVEGATEDDALVNGQSVRVEIPTVAPTNVGEGPTLLPLSAVKLYADSRVVFTVNEEGRLVATPVEIGEVRGDRVEILSPLPAELRIVIDARGLAAGEKVQISTGP